MMVIENIKGNDKIEPFPTISLEEFIKKYLTQQEIQEIEIKSELIKAFELCKTAIKVLHPILDPDEPCIAWEAYSEAECQIVKLSN